MAKRRDPRTMSSMDDDDEDVTGEQVEQEEKPRKKKKKKKKKRSDDGDDDYFEEPDAPTPKTQGKKPAVKPVPMVSLDPPRKLSKKDLDKLAEWQTPRRGALLDSFFARQVTEARKKFGSTGVYMGSEAEALVIGIPTPSLAFEYVTAQSCFPLGLVIQIVAKHGVGKSALLAEFGRWFDAAGGGMILKENETKFNPHWYVSIMGSEAYGRMQLHRCKSVEDWQRKMTWSIKKMQEDMIGTAKEPGPGRTFPVLFGVDSIMGKMSEENQEKILGKEGAKGKRGTTGTGSAPARAYPIEAGSITKYMRTVPQLIDQWPFSLVLVNHLRVKTDDMGNTERSKTGGEQVNFQESFELELKKIGGHAKKIAVSNFEGVTLQLSCEKNSFGPTGRKTHVRLLWWYEQEGNELRQRTVWDWDWATVYMLDAIRNGEVSTYLKARLLDIDFHIACPSRADAENSAWSKTLGMTEADAVSWGDLGAMISEDVGLVDKLRDALGITKRPLLAGDYVTQLHDAASRLP